MWNSEQTLAGNTVYSLSWSSLEADTEPRDSREGPVHDEAEELTGPTAHSLSDRNGI